MMVVTHSPSGRRLGHSKGDGAGVGKDRRTQGSCERCWSQFTKQLVPHNAAQRIAFDADSPLGGPTFAPLFGLTTRDARPSNRGNVSKHVVSRLIVHLGLEGILILEGVCSGRRGPSIDQVEPTLKMRH